MSNEGDNNIALPPKTVFKELIGKRDICSKHFLNDDGTVTAEIHNIPIHYVEEEQYKEIHLDISPDENWETSYAVKENTFKSYFHDIEDVNPILSSFERTNNNGDIRWINFKPINSNPSETIVNNNKITYKNAYENVDISYTVESLRIKEEIIIHNPIESYNFTFTIKHSEGIRWEFDEDVISFYDTDTTELLWVLEKPFIQDNIGVEKHCVSYSMGEIEYNDVIYTTVSLNTQVEDIDGLIFPLIIDPVISPSGNTTGRVQRAGSSYPPSGSINAFTPLIKMFKTYTGSQYINSIGLAKFNVSTIPANSTINSAVLTATSSNIINSNSLFLRAEWYHYSSISTSHYTDLVSNSSDSVWMNNSSLNSGSYSLTWSTPSEISNRRNSGQSEVGVRWGLSGNAPAGVNEIELLSPVLTVNYTTASVIAPTTFGFSPDQITHNSMRMRGYLYNDGGQGCDVYILWGTSSGNLSNLVYVGSNYTSGTYIYFTATGLSPNTTYYYQALSVNSAGSSYSPTQSGTTTSTPVSSISAETLTAGTITSTSIQMRGRLNDTAGQTCYVRIAWSINSNLSPVNVTSAIETTTPITIEPTITGLLSGTTYYYRVEVFGQTQTVFGSIFSATTSSGSPPTPTGLTAGNPPRVDAGLNVIWNASSGATLYRIRIKLGSGGTYSEYTTTSTNYSFTGLNYGDSYYISVRAENNIGVSSYTADSILTTAPRTPTVSFVSSTETSISVSTNVSQGNWSFVRVWYRLIGGSWNSIVLTNPTTSGDITGLSNATQYEIKASSFYTVNGVDLESRDSSGGIGYSASLFITTGGGRPNNWAWSYNISSGQNVYQINGKDIIIMPATEWNNFTTRINQFRVYKGLSNYAFTTVSSGTTFTRTIINEALTAIRNMSTHFTGGNAVPSNRIVGQEILVASYYQQMRDALNSIL
jgi:hypothetical protein